MDGEICVADGLGCSRRVEMSETEEEKWNNNLICADAMAY